MFAKFRYKGKICFQYIGENKYSFNIPEGKDCVDLTSFPVMFFAGKRPEEKIYIFRNENPNYKGFFIWEKNSSFSFGQGLIIPDWFDVKRVVFVKGPEQEKEEYNNKNYQEILKIMEKLKDNKKYSFRLFNNEGHCEKDGIGFYFNSIETFNRAHRLYFDEEVEF